MAICRWKVPAPRVQCTPFLSSTIPETSGIVENFAENSGTHCALHREIGPCHSEPVFVYLFRSPGIDSQPGGPVRQPYLLYRPAKLHRPTDSISRNQFPGSLNVYKYWLWSGWRTFLSGFRTVYTLYWIVRYGYVRLRQCFKLIQKNKRRILDKFRCFSRRVPMDF